MQVMRTTNSSDGLRDSGPCSSQAVPVGVLPLKTRLSRALLEFSSQMAASGQQSSGALVQVWMPEQCADGTVVLSAQGLPFAIAGVGDLLALFRCVSVRYRFSTDVMKPSLMGAPGRVYATLEPEMSNNVQKYDKKVYLRVSEAQRCRVHSALMMPVFDKDCADKPLAVFELVQSDKEVVFPALIAWLRQCLESVQLSTCNVDHLAVTVGLRKWPMHVEQSLGADFHHLQRLTPEPQGGQDHSTQQNAEEVMEDTKEGPSASTTKLETDGEAAGGRRTSSAANTANLSGLGQKDKDTQMQQIMAWMQQSGLGPDALQTFKSMMTGQAGKAGNTAALMAAAAGLKTGPSMSDVAKPAGKQAPAKSLSGQRRPADADDDEDFSSGGEDEDSDEEGGRKGANNRVGGGAGRRLTYEDLQAQFGLGLKEAATNLGICATTLKRACRRHGIKRWPRRQIAKLSKALNQMGYAGTPPPALVHSAVTSQTAGAPSPGASTATKTPQLTLPLGVTLQQQQAAAAAAVAQQQQHLKQLQAVQQLQAGQVQGMQGCMPPPMSMSMMPGMLNPATMQAFMQQAGMAGMAGMMGPVPQMLQMPPQPPLAPPPQNLQQQHQLQQQQHQQQHQEPMFMHPNTGLSGATDLQGSNRGQAMGPMPTFGQNPMRFMFDDFSGNGAAIGGAALVNELGPPGPPGMMLGGSGHGHAHTSSMHMSSALLPIMNRSSVGNLGGASEMNLVSGFSLPPSEMLDVLDVSVPAMLPAPSMGTSQGLNSQAQMAAIHDFFKNAPGSLESFMEMLSDDLPLV